MATQTGSIDLRGANSAKLYVDDEAGEIRTEVSETYATKTEVRRTNSGTGTVITSDDAANLPPLSLTVHGKSVQDGTPSPSSPVPIQSVEGRNLYNLNGNLGGTNKCTYTVDGDEVVMSATGTDGFIGNVSTSVGVTWSAANGLLMPVVGGEQYVLRFGNPFFSKNYITWWGSDKKSISYVTILDSMRTFTAPDGAAYASIRYGNVSTAAGAVYRTTVFFGRGADFEWYGYQPYESISAVTVGKNIARLIPTNNISESGGALSGTLASFYRTYDDNKISCVVCAPSGEFFPETTTVSLEAYTDGTSSTSGTGLVVIARNSSNTNAKRMVQAPNSTSAWTKFSSDLSGTQNVTKIVITYSSASANIWHVRNFCIRTDGSTEYEPFDGSTIHIPLQGNPLRSLPDGTEDTLAIDSEGNVTLTKRVGEVTFDGSEGFAWTALTTASSSLKAFLIRATGGSAKNWSSVFGESTLPIQSIAVEDRVNVLANRLQPSNQHYNAWTSPQVIMWGDASAAIIIAIDESVTTSAQVNTWLASNPLTVVYKLNTPQTIDLGKVNLPSLLSPFCSMHVDAAVSPTLDAEWWTQGGEEVGSVYQRTSALEQDVDGITLELSEKVDSSEEWVSWLHAGTDATTHEPYLAMGKDSDYPSVVYSTDAARFYDGEGDDESNVVASFGTEGVVVGKDGSANTTISDSEIVFHDANGNEAGKISMSSAGAVPASASHTITAGDAQQTYTLEGLTPLPDFTLGYLVVNLFYNGTLNNRYRYTSIAEAEFTVSIDTYNDATFTAAQSGDTWGATMTAQHRVVGETADFTFSLEWVYLGTAPIYEFGTTENTGAYSFSAGTGLVAAGQSQAVFGKYNKPSETDLFILGNGTSDGNRSNALKVDSQGTLETSGYFQSGGVVGLGTEAQQGWLTALGPFMRFAEVTTATQSISSGSVGYFSVAAPTYTGYTLRGAIQSWASGSGTVIIGASYRSSADNNMHFVVRANNTASVAVKALLLYTLDAITS